MSALESSAFWLPRQILKQQYKSTKSYAAIIASWRASAPPPKAKAAFIKTSYPSLRISGHSHHPEVKFGAFASVEAVLSGISLMKDEVQQQQEGNEPPNSPIPENNSPRRHDVCQDSNECGVGQGDGGNGSFGPPNNPWGRGRGEDDGNPPYRQALGSMMMDEDAKSDIIMLGIPWKGATDFATGFVSGGLVALALPVKSRDPLSVSEASKEDEGKGSSRSTNVVANKVFGWVGDFAPDIKLTLSPGAVGFGCGLIFYHIISVLLTGGRDKK